MYRKSVSCSLKRLRWEHQKLTIKVKVLMHFRGCFSLLCFSSKLSNSIYNKFFQSSEKDLDPQFKVFQTLDLNNHPVKISSVWQEAHITELLILCHWTPPKHPVWIWSSYWGLCKVTARKFPIRAKSRLSIAAHASYCQVYVCRNCCLFTSERLEDE